MECCLRPFYIIYRYHKNVKLAMIDEDVDHQMREVNGYV